MYLVFGSKNHLYKPAETHTTTSNINETKPKKTLEQDPLRAFSLPRDYLHCKLFNNETMRRATYFHTNVKQIQTELAADCDGSSNDFFP